MPCRIIIAILCLTHLRLWSAEELGDGEPKLVQEIRAELPAGWECRFEPGDNTKYVASGMPRPEFVIVVTNPKVAIESRQYPTRDLLEAMPVIPLCFYAIKRKSLVQEIIEQQKIFSRSIPIYFGETDSHIVVTSPAWVNLGNYWRESRRSIRAPVNMLLKFIRAKENQPFAQMLLSDTTDEAMK